MMCNTDSPTSALELMAVGVVVVGNNDVPGAAEYPMDGSLKWLVASVTSEEIRPVIHSCFLV